MSVSGHNCKINRHLMLRLTADILNSEIWRHTRMPHGSVIAVVF